MARGRKRKSGQRERNGRLQRTPRIDKGTERTQAKMDLYHGNGTDPIGRAYERGLLGKGTDAKTLLDMARSINFAYWAAYQTAPIRCTLADSGHSGAENPEASLRREKWLGHMLQAAGGARQAFDSLVIDIHPDSGPVWLDRLLTGDGRPNDTAMLNAALDVLADCAGMREAA